MRQLVLALLLLNVALLGWNQGWLPAVLGIRADDGREPERLARQVRPETVRVVLPPGAGAEITAPSAAVCLEAGPFTPIDLAAAEQALAPLPAGRWQRVTGEMGTLLRIDAADPALQAQLQALPSPALGAGFHPCAPR